MKKVLLGIAGMLLVTAGAVAVAASMQPGTTHVERSVTVTAGAVDLEPHIADFTNFVNWSPWTGLDPEQVSRFSDPPGGPGAWYSWEGNRDVGRGRMDLTVHEAGRVTHHLTFIEPFPAEADAHFLWSEVDGGLEVTWTYDAENDFLAKTMSLFMDMDSLLGPDYERGLARLKNNVETDARVRREKERRAAERAAAEAPGAGG